MFRRLVAVVLLPLVALAIAIPAHAAPRQQNDQRCFTETTHCISGRFREFWEKNGGLPVFGLPLTPAAEEASRETGQRYLTQWFERARFELHADQPAPYDVLLGRLGEDQLQRNGVTWQSLTRDTGPKPNCRWFPQTGFNVCDQLPGQGFKTYWETHGLEFDGKPGTSYEESLALFGLPLTTMSTETTETSGTILTQWFERARFEWHTGPDGARLLLGLLGNEVREDVGPGR